MGRPNSMLDTSNNQTAVNATFWDCGRTAAESHRQRSSISCERDHRVHPKAISVFTGKGSPFSRHSDRSIGSRKTVIADDENPHIVNNVPMGLGTSGFYGPWIDPNEILRSWH
jgi:hypothetical protein